MGRGKKSNYMASRRWPRHNVVLLKEQHPDMGPVLRITLLAFLVKATVRC